MSFKKFKESSVPLATSRPEVTPLSAYTEAPTTHDGASFIRYQQKPLPLSSIQIF